MLEELFGSKTRLKLLKFLFSHPDEAYFIRELTRKIDSQINAVRRELTKLNKLKLVSVVERLPEGSSKQALWGKNKGVTKKKSIKSKQREKKFFKINKEHILYPELKALFLKSQLLVERDLINKLGDAGRIKYLALTGIFLAVESVPTDLFVVGSINKNKLSRLVKRVEKELETALNYTVMTSQEFKYRKDITDRFLYSILEAKKIVIIDKLGLGKFEDEQIKSMPVPVEE